MFVDSSALVASPSARPSFVGPLHRTGNFTMFTFDPAGSPFRFLTRYTSALAVLQRMLDSGFRGSGRLGNALRRRYIEPRARALAAHAPAAFIPFHILPLIGVSEDEKPIHMPGALPAESIFDVLSRIGVDYTYLMFPEVNCEDDRTFELTLERIGERRRLYLVQFSDSDLLCPPPRARLDDAPPGDRRTGSQAPGAEAGF